MEWTNALYEYDGSFQGLLCCVFDSYTRKERPLSISCGTQEQTSLDPVHQVIAVPEHTRRIADSIRAHTPGKGAFCAESLDAARNVKGSSARLAFVKKRTFVPCTDQIGKNFSNAQYHMIFLRAETARNSFIFSFPRERMRRGPRNRFR